MKNSTEDIIHKFKFRVQSIEDMRAKLGKAICTRKRDIGADNLFDYDDGMRIVLYKIRPPRGKRSTKINVCIEVFIERESPLDTFIHPMTEASVANGAALLKRRLDELFNQNGASTITPIMRN